LGITLAPVRNNATNEVSINLFTLQHTGQAIDDAKKHHIVGECGGQSTDSPLEEGLPHMD
jgi:hypothetical protein